MKAARLDPEALTELREAAGWYKERSPKVARRFVENVRELARKIARRPLQFPQLSDPPIEPPVRRALVPGFPYALVFVVNGSSVHVVAVVHQHRLPGYWLYRIRDDEE
ncbi:MAG TPA: type II toxin-antitoxin system RelE/ParE family toxin [Polyangium sp.]|nr:type II toxin-antitoxin system RelE/ParE family toxin [Polyangium sp.]